MEVKVKVIEDKVQKEKNIRLVEKYLESKCD